MKIAVSTDDYITVCGHVGRCKGFMIFEIENGEILKVQKRDNNFSNRVSKKRRAKVYLTSNHIYHHQNSKGRFKNHGHLALAKGLDDCDYLISLGTGWDMQEDLEQLGVKHIVSVEKNIDDAVKKLISNLKSIQK